MKLCRVLPVWMKKIEIVKINCTFCFSNFLTDFHWDLKNLTEIKTFLEVWASNSLVSGEKKMQSSQHHQSCIFSSDFVTAAVWTVFRKTDGSMADWGVRWFQDWTVICGSDNGQTCEHSTMLKPRKNLAEKWFSC